MPNKAYVLKEDGTTVNLAHQPNLQEAQKLVGGYIEKLPTYPQAKLTRVIGSARRSIYGDEDGRTNGRPVNLNASGLLGYEVVGDILIIEGWEGIK